jgi:hypothetical protein
MKDSQASSVRPANAKELEQYIASLESYLARPSGRQEKHGTKANAQGDNGRTQSGAKASKSETKSSKKH